MKPFKIMRVPNLVADVALQMPPVCQVNPIAHLAQLVSELLAAHPFIALQGMHTLGDTPLHNMCPAEHIEHFWLPVNRSYPQLSQFGSAQYIDGMQLPPEGRTLFMQTEQRFVERYEKRQKVDIWELRGVHTWAVEGAFMFWK